MKLVLAILPITMTFTRAARTDSAFAHIYEQMDRYHLTFDVYTDADAGGNHYEPSEWMNGVAVQLDPFWSPGLDSTMTCIRCRYIANSAEWAGVGWVDAQGYDLTGADTCWFWAKGEVGGERIEFGVGGRPRDSIHEYTTVTLTDRWSRYAIPLRGGVLRNLHRGFYWVATRINNPQGCVFYVDNIQFNQQRVDSLRFILTYVPLHYPHDRTWALNQAYTYSNALAMISMVSRGSSEDMERARKLGDAFALCQVSDRLFTDGRLRNAYMTGDIISRTTGKARLPGWWDPDSQRWFEDAYQTGTYVGEMAWLMVAWSTYDLLTGTFRYRENVRRLGTWIHDSCWSTTVQAYRGGYEGPDTSPRRMNWFSTEHHLDLYVAFSLLYEETNDTVWLSRAERSLSFVRRMWDPGRRYFRCGMKDSMTVDTLPALDAQTWGLLATLDTGYSQAIRSAESLCRRTALGHHGFCFSARGDGIWWEGTAQMCCAYMLLNRIAQYDSFASELRWCQDFGLHGNRRGITSCLPESSYTGFDRYWGRSYYYARLDIAATAWFIFSEIRRNPFWQTPLSGLTCPDRSQGSTPVQGLPTVYRGSSGSIAYSLNSAELYDTVGRRLGKLSCVTDVTGRLASGVYFLICPASHRSDRSRAVTKLIVQ